MAIFKSFTFDGVNSLTYGVYVTGLVYGAPERAVETYPIPGRNGALAIDQGRFENIAVTYQCGCFAEDQATFAQMISEFRNALCSRYSYARLTDDYHPTEFRLALYSAGLELEPEGQMSKAGQFEVVFDAKPQRFLTSGETYTTYGQNSTITNATRFTAKPLIRVTGYGTVTIGSVTITITGSSGVVTYIDCDLMECYRLSGSAIVPANSAVSFSGNDFPVLPVGNTGVTYAGSVTKVEIQPRWWII